MAMNWLIEISSRSASSRIFLCKDSGNRRLNVLMIAPREAPETQRVCTRVDESWTRLRSLERL
jgi:hypothetical protein